MPLPRVGLEERGTPMLDARTARILAKENEEDIEARRRREMVERCEKNIEKAVNEGRLDAVLFVGGLDDAKRGALEVMRGRGFEIGEEVWREGKERGGRGDGHKKSDVAEMAAGSHG